MVCKTSFIVAPLVQVLLHCHAIKCTFWGLQMISLALLLLSSRGADIALVDAAATAGPPLLGVAAILTVSSFAQYMRGLWPYLF